MKEKGFTLIELMLTLSLVGIILSVSIISFKSFLVPLKIRACTEEIINTLYMARIKAVNEKVNYCIFFDVNNLPQRYTLFKDNGDTPRLLDDNDTVIILNKELPRGVRFGITGDPVTFKDGSKDTDTAIFTPRGTSNGGTLYLENSTNKDIKYKMTVRSSTGKITVTR